MANEELKQFANFETLVTPKIITIFYWVVTLLTIIVGGVFISRFGDSEILTLVLFAILVIIRVMFELTIVCFKNNEYLRRICEAAEARKGE